MAFEGHVRQMFPSRNLDGEDLIFFCRDKNNNMPVAVTIENIDFKTYDNDEMGEPGINYFMKVREFKKPFKLSQQRCETIAEVLGSELTKDWIGRVICIKGDRITYGKNKFWVIQPVIDPPPAHSTLGANLDITNYAFDSKRMTASPRPMQNLPAGGPSNAVLGVDIAVKVLSGLHMVNKRLDEFVEWAKMTDPSLYSTVHGKPLIDYPQSATTGLKTFCAMWPRINEKFNEAQESEARAKLCPPASGDIIDPKTGEVLKADDIPF